VFIRPHISYSDAFLFAANVVILFQTRFVQHAISESGSVRGILFCLNCDTCSKVESCEKVNR